MSESEQLIVDFDLREKAKPRKKYAVIYDGHQVGTIISNRDIRYCVVTYWEKLGIRNKPWIHSRTNNRAVAQRAMLRAKQNYKDQRDVPRQTPHLGYRVSVIADLKQIE